MAIMVIHKIIVVKRCLRVCDRIGGLSSQAESLPYNSRGQAQRRPRIVTTANPSTLNGSSKLCSVGDGMFMRLLQGRMERVIGFRGLRPASAELAHGYYRSALQAVSGCNVEAAGSVTDPVLTIRMLCAEYLIVYTMCSPRQRDY